METTTCTHREKITNIESGVDEGVCGGCHQVRRYERKEQKEGKTRMICKVIKLGRIDGKVVVPGANEILELSPEESAELKVATKAPSVNKAGNSLPPEQPAQRGREWYQAHKEEMIEDLITMGYAAFLEKWKVKHQIVSHLKTDKLYMSRVARAETPGGRGSKPKDSRFIKTVALKCKGCEFHLIHDEQAWCTSKRCRSRYPTSVRPPYRPQIIERPQSPGEKGRSPSDSKVAKGNHASPLEAIKKAKVDNMPPFPDWAPEKWASSEIAVQWLRTYETLSRLELIHELVLCQPSAKKRNWLTRLFRQ